MFNKIPVLVLALVIATVFMCGNMAKAGEPVLDGLVSYWTFDEKDIYDETLKDIVGPNDGTIAGDLEIVPGKVGEAGFFDDSDVSIHCGNDLSLTLRDGLTMEFWVNWNGKRYSPLGSKEGSYLLCIKDNGKIVLTYETEAQKWADWSTGYLVPMNEWVHLAMVYDGEQMMLYADGELSRQKPVTGALLPSGDPFLIGVYRVPAWCDGAGNCRALSGYIDEVRLYDRGLSAAEVMQNFESKGFLAVSANKKLVETWGGNKGFKVGPVSSVRTERLSIDESLYLSRNRIPNHQAPPLSSVLTTHPVPDLPIEGQSL